MSPQGELGWVPPPLLGLDGLSWGKEWGWGEQRPPPPEPSGLWLQLCHRGRGGEGRVSMRACLTSQRKGRWVTCMAASWAHLVLSSPRVSALAQDIRVYPIQSPAPKHTHAHTLIPDGKTEAQKQEVTCLTVLVPRAWTPLSVCR